MVRAQNNDGRNPIGLISFWLWILFLLIPLHAISWKHRETLNFPLIIGVILLTNFDHDGNSVPNGISSITNLCEHAKLIRFFSALD